MDTKQSQIEDVVSNYGQVLDLKLELTIRDGKQTLAAVAQFVFHSFLHAILTFFSVLESLPLFCHLYAITSINHG